MEEQNIEENKTVTKENLEEWERIREEEMNLTLEQRKENQFSKLENILTSLHALFGSSLITAAKSLKNQALTPEENISLNSDENRGELVARITGLEKVFGSKFYDVLNTVAGSELFAVEQEAKKVTPENDEPEEAAVRIPEPTRTAKLPKGFNKWDLKLIKLHESKPEEDKRIWVEFWSLKGISYIGEILFNPTKELFFFRPLDSANPSFALTEEQGRKATMQARNYYYRVAASPIED